MYRQICKNTVITTLRNPATLLSLIAVILLWYNMASPLLSLTNQIELGMHKFILNAVAMPVNDVMPVFAAVVCSVGILQDKKNRFYDIEKVTAMKTLPYYLGKITAFCAVIFFVMFIFIALFSIFRVTVGAESAISHTMSVFDLTTRLLRTGFVLITPSMFVYISIPVVISLLTNSVAAGIASGVVYSLFGRMFSIALNESGYFYDNYVYPVTDKIWRYMYYYDTPYFEDTIQNPFSPTSLNDVILSYAVTILPCVALFIIGYIILKRRED